MIDLIPSKYIYHIHLRTNDSINQNRPGLQNPGHSPRSCLQAHPAMPGWPQDGLDRRRQPKSSLPREAHSPFHVPDTSGLSQRAEENVVLARIGNMSRRACAMLIFDAQLPLPLSTATSLHCFGTWREVSVPHRHTRGRPSTMQAPNKQFLNLLTPDRQKSDRILPFRAYHRHRASLQASSHGPQPRPQPCAVMPE